MHILLINSSSRKQGNTAEILGRFARSLAGGSSDAECVNLADYAIKTCRGCRICFDRGEECCPLADDLAALGAKLEAADLVIFGSPVYVEDVNGVMKNFIDRLAFNSHRPHYGGKKAYVLATSGIGSTRHTLTTMTRALGTWGMTVLGSSRYACGARISTDEAERLYGKKILHETAKIAVGMKRRKPSFIPLLYFGVQKLYYARQADTASYDYAYWKARGWLEKKAAYFDVPVRGFRALLARTLSRFIAIFVL